MINQVPQHILELYNEVDCRIEHGADSNRHLEYVRDRLKKILDLMEEPKVTTIPFESGTLVIKPCPFCGSPADIKQVPNTVDGYPTVFCTGSFCGVSLEHFSKDKAVEKWNRRVDV